MLEFPVKCKPSLQLLEWAIQYTLFKHVPEWTGYYKVVSSEAHVQIIDGRFCDEKIYITVFHMNLIPRMFVHRLHIIKYEIWIVNEKIV